MKTIRVLYFMCLMSLIIVSHAISGNSCCSRHGGIDGCDRQSGYFKCKDGSLSKCFCVSTYPFKRTAIVFNVIDAQTIEVEYRGIRTRIGLYGIKGPEKNSPYFEQAVKYISDMVLDKSVSFEPVVFDPYGSDWAWVYHGDINLNRELVGLGLCYWDKNRTPAQKELEEIENEAKAGRKGLWGGIRHK